MDTQKITESLSKIFHTEGHRIVFWYDQDQEFLDTFQSLDLDDIKLVNLSEESLLEIKVRLELEDLDSKYLLYSPTQEPEPERLALGHQAL